MSIETQLQQLLAQAEATRREMARIATPVVPAAYKVGDAAKALGVSRTVIDQMIRQGHLATIVLPTMTDRRIPAWALAQLVGDPSIPPADPG